MVFWEGGYELEQEVKSHVLGALLVLLLAACELNEEVAHLGELGELLSEQDELEGRLAVGEGVEVAWFSARAWSLPPRGM